MTIYINQRYTDNNIKIRIISVFMTKGIFKEGEEMTKGSNPSRNFKLRN